MNSDFINIIKYAAKAPSGHNTQPWRFSFTENTISIKPNFNVSLPVVDGDNRELYISLGCAVENLLITATHFGYVTHILQSDNTEIRVKLMRSNQVEKDSLFYQIERRQTNRSLYNGKKITDLQIEKQQAILQDENLKVYFAEIGTQLANTLTGYIAKGNEI